MHDEPVGIWDYFGVVVASGVLLSGIVALALLLSYGRRAGRRLVRHRNLLQVVSPSSVEADFLYLAMRTEGVRAAAGSASDRRTWSLVVSGVGGSLIVALLVAALGVTFASVAVPALWIGIVTGAALGVGIGVPAVVVLSAKERSVSYLVGRAAPEPSGPATDRWGAGGAAPSWADFVAGRRVPGSALVSEKN